MTKFFLTLIVMMLFSLLASAQDKAPADSTTTTAEVDEASAAEQADAGDVEDVDLDEQTYEQDEDDFIPSEEIPADEPIPFPTNI
jgi:hypothetical protein